MNIHYSTFYFFLIAIICLPCKAMNVKKPRDIRKKEDKVELQFRNRQKTREKIVLTEKRIKARKRHGIKKDAPLPETTITMSNMTYDEMRNRKNELLAIETEKNTKSRRYLFKIKQKTNQNKHIAAKYLERMAKMCDNPDERANLLIEMADIQFDIGELKKAEATYREFNDLYPGHKKIEYAYYKALLCAFYHTLTFDRDQTSTYDAIQLADQFLDRVDLFQEYQDEVINIRKQCYKRIIESEFNVCSFYLNRSSFKAVENRLEIIRSKFMPEVPEIEPQLIAFEANLATKRAEFIAYYNIQESPKVSEEPKNEAQVIAQTESEESEVSKSLEKPTSFAQRF